MGLKQLIRFASSKIKYNIYIIFDIIKHIKTFYYNNNNIEVLASKIIITIIATIIKNIKLPKEKKLKNINKRGNKKKTKIIIIIALLMEKTKIKSKNKKS